MTTIDKLDISVHNTYAIRTRMLEQINQQLRFNEAASIPPQTQIINTYAQLTDVELLLGITSLHTPWAHFYPPTRYRNFRRSPFTFSRILPSFGSDEEQKEDLDYLLSIPCKTPEEEEEKAAIMGCLKQLGTINGWLDFIVGRIGQFLQG